VAGILSMDQKLQTNFLPSCKLLRNLPAFCFQSSATIKTCKLIYFS